MTLDKLFGLRPDPPPPPEPPRQLNCTILWDDQTQVEMQPVYTELIIDDAELDGGIRYGGRIEQTGRFVIHFPGCAPKGQGAWMTVQVKGGSWRGRIVTPIAGSVEMGQDGGDSYVTLARSSTDIPFEPRHGLVRTSGRSWYDDDGPFYPLGQTLFWAMQGYRTERERLEQNLKFLQEQGWHYIRILGMVGWDGYEIDPTWPDYCETLAGVVDTAYDKYGLRTQITVSGGGDWDPIEATKKVCSVIPGREHKILMLEAANESFNNGPDLETMQEMGDLLHAALPTAMVALSAPADGAPDTAEEWGHANGFVLHLDRTDGDDHWRHVRQGYDFKDGHLPASSNEPIGPASSVKSEDDPLRLAMSRATSILCGAEDYTFHNASGVYGSSDPSRGRTPNLWEMPNIEAQMKAVRDVTSILPAGIGSWTVANDGWVPPMPVCPLHCIEWNESVGPIKSYAALSGPSFVVAPHGIRAAFTFEATDNLEYAAYDPLTLQVVQQGQLVKGQQSSIEFADDSRQHALIFVGQMR